MTKELLFHSKYALLFSFIFFSSCSDGQHLDCNRFTNGSFKIIDTTSGTSFIIRTGENQTEITEGNTDSTTLIVKWLNDCTYTLVPTEETRRKNPSLPVNAMLTVEIIETQLNSYIQITTSNFSDMKLTNEVIKTQ